MMYEIAYGFYLSIKKCSFCEFFGFCPPTPYALRPRILPNGRPYYVLRYIHVVSFIIMAFVVVKLKISGLIQRP